MEIRMAQIVFSFDSPYGTFCDALNLPDDHGFSDAELDAMKQQRFDSWIAVVTNPPPEDVTEQA